MIFLDVMLYTLVGYKCFASIFRQYETTQHEITKYPNLNTSMRISCLHSSCFTFF